jgi:hypothetical protein
VNGTDGSEGGSYGRYIAEVSIPAAKTGSVSGLNRATALQSRTSSISTASPQDTQGQPAYSAAKGDQSSAKIYLPSYIYYNVDGSLFTSLGWIDTNLSSPNSAGAWNITSSGDDMVNKTGGYTFMAPQSWADEHTDGKSLIIGFHRGYGNYSSNGPTMFAVAPWEAGNPPANNADIPSKKLLLYPSIDTEEGGTDSNPITNFRSGYSMNDHARGATWIEWGGKRAVLFVGTAGTQSNYCYGSGCSSAICSPIQGPNCPPYYPAFWWYDVDDFEAVAAGTIGAHEPSPYAEEYNRNTYYTGQCADFYESAAFDTTTGRLYVAEGYVNTGASWETVVHVFELEEVSTAPRAKSRGVKWRR